MVSPSSRLGVRHQSDAWERKQILAELTYHYDLPSEIADLFA